MVFVIRVRDPLGMHRLVFPSAGATWAELQQQVEDVTKLPVALQLLSRAPLHKPEYMEPRGTDTLQALKLQNGDVLYVAGHTDATLKAQGAASGGAASAASSSAAAGSSGAAAAAPKKHALTPRCNHAPHGACPHCLGVEPGTENKAVQGKCNHGPHTTCIHCSKTVKEQTKDLPVWLCNHPDTVFCPKCLPPEPSPEMGVAAVAKVLPCDCDRSKGQECSRCLAAHTRPTIKVDKLPFARWLDEKKGLCKFKHGANTTCAMCIPPELPSFVGKKDCNKGHQPWPHGVCLSCAPPNATIREQPYRHCDTVSMSPFVATPFIQAWLNSGSNFQRAAILFGRYSDEPDETNNPGAIRATVHALYEPPQENAKDFVRFLRDPHEGAIHALAARLGIEVVGWMVTTVERSGDKYGGKVVMSGLEVQQAARFQNRYKNALGYSRFVTVVLEKPKDAAGGVEPRAYQVSDLAVCLERDGVFAKAADPNMLCTRVPKQGEMVPSVVYKDRPLLPGAEFLPDEFIVKVIASAPGAGETQVFRRAEFPPLAAQPTDAMLKAYLAKHGKEGLPARMADFNLLAYLFAKQVLPEKLLLELADAIKNRTQLSRESMAQLDAALITKGLV